MRSITIFLAISALLLVQCEVYREGCMDPNATNYDVAADIDDGSCVYTINSFNSNCQDVEAGNLSVTNNTGELLYLYSSVNGVSQEISCIPANAEDFVLYISNEFNEVHTLQVWKANDLDNINDPDINKVYRQWSVALSNTTLVSERANWLITDSDVNKSSGTLSLTYPSLDEYNQEVIYQVDIYLNSKSGARLASLQPGVSNKKVSVDYGAHYLYFKYWYSDPNSSSGEIDEIGWNQIDDVVINAEHKTAYIEIPVYYSNIGKYGNLKIYNSTSNAISIYADDLLIENIAKVDGSSEGLSIIPSNNSTTFLIPEDTYTISAKSIDGSTTIATFKYVDVIQSDTAIFDVGARYKEISITNNTTQKLLLYSEDGNYLGKIIEAGSSSGPYLVDSQYDSLLVLTADKSKSKKIASGTGIVVNDLESYFTQNLSITNSWTEIGTNYYQSPDINDNETTTMTATLVNTSTVLLSFEYNVSSEYGYDKFHFNIDGSYKIADESGSTGWKNYSVNIEPGTHSLQWIYQKDEMFSLENDNVEIRNITVN